jgi:hypothetical protein
MPKMKDLVELVFNLWCERHVQNRKNPETSKAARTILVLGPPGIGKTSMAREVAKMQTAYMRQQYGVKYQEAQCAIVDLSRSLPEDINGLPKVDGAVMRFVPDQWLYDICQPKAYGVLVLDDLPAATNAVQVAARQVSLDHRAHEHIIQDDVIIIATGNRREDKSNANTLPAHYRNSCLMLDLDPDLDTWLEWYSKQNLDPMVAGYLIYRPTSFSTLPDKADKRGVFATPRTWAMLGEDMVVARGVRQVFNVASGLVGEGIAAEFKAFIDLADQLVNPRLVLENPEQHIPDPSIFAQNVDRMIATLTGICEIAAKDNSPAMIKKLWRAWGHICSVKAEYISVALQAFRASGGDRVLLTRVANEVRKTDPRVRALCETMSRGLDMRSSA